MREKTKKIVIVTINVSFIICGFGALFHGWNSEDIYEEVAGAVMLFYGQTRANSLTIS